MSSAGQLPRAVISRCRRGSCEVGAPAAPRGRQLCQGNTSRAVIVDQMQSRCLLSLCSGRAVLRTMAASCHVWGCTQERLMGVAAGPCNMRGWLRMHVHFHTRVCCISTQTGNVKLPGQRGLMCDISGWDCWLHAKSGDAAHWGAANLSFGKSGLQTKRVDVLGHCQPACSLDYMCKGQQSSEPKQESHIWQI